MYSKYGEYTKQVYQKSDIKLYNRVRREYIGINWESKKRNKTTTFKSIKAICKNNYNCYTMLESQEKTIREYLRKSNQSFNLVSALIDNGKSFYIYEIRDTKFIR